MPTKEVFELMLNNQQYFKAGLCYWLDLLHSQGLINLEDRLVARRYVQNNRPSKFSSRDVFKYRNSLFYWEIGNIEPRIKWLNEHIQKLSNTSSNNE